MLIYQPLLLKGSQGKNIFFLIFSKRMAEVVKDSKISPLACTFDGDLVSYLSLLHLAFFQMRAYDSSSSGLGHNFLSYCLENSLSLLGMLSLIVQ